MSTACTFRIPPAFGLDGDVCGQPANVRLTPTQYACWDHVDVYRQQLREVGDIDPNRRYWTLCDRSDERNDHHMAERYRARWHVIYRQGGVEYEEDLCTPCYRGLYSFEVREMYKLDIEEVIEEDIRA